MTDVAEDRDQAGAELSAADEQVLRELTERARTGGLKLTGEGGLLGRLTKMVIEGALVLPGAQDPHLGGVHDADEEPGISGGVVGKVPGYVGEVPDSRQILGGGCVCGQAGAGNGAGGSAGRGHGQQPAAGQHVDPRPPAGVL